MSADQYSASPWPADVAEGFNVWSAALRIEHHRLAPFQAWADHITF